MSLLLNIGVIVLGIAISCFLPLRLSPYGVFLTFGVVASLSFYLVVRCGQPDSTVGFYFLPLTTLAAIVLPILIQNDMAKTGHTVEHQPGGDA